MALAYLLVLVVVALEVPLATSVARRVDAEVRSQARGQADVVAASASDLLGAGRDRDRERLVDAAAESVRGRVILVDRGGDLLADSEGAPPGRSYSGRAEVAAALAGRRDQRERESQTLGETLLVTSVPVLERGLVAGAVRISQSTAAVDRAVHRAWLGLALIGLLVLTLGMLAGSLLARQIVRPITRLDAAARRVAEGDLATQAPVEGSAEQRSLATTFNLMTGRLAELVRSQRDFVADASHGLRTPLTGLRLRVEAARAETAEAATAAELDAALAELDRLARMVDELLELSRAGEPGTRGDRVALTTLASDTADRWAATAATRGRSLGVVGEGGTSVWIDRADADRILDVLVENALHYGAGEVEVAVTPGAITIRDEGPGPAAGEEERVFERFHRGHAGRQGAPGSGLGLPIARELARRWGGEVTLARHPAGGALAELRLPPA